MKKITIIAVTIMLLCSTAITNCLANNNTLKVGVTADYPPFEFTKQGTLQGLSIDLAKTIAASMGKKLEFKDMAFNSLIPALQSRKIDMIISSINITPERNKNVDFSIPYYSSTFSLLSLKTSQVKSVEDLHNKIVGVQLGSTMEEFAKSISKHLEFKVLALDSNLVLIQELNKKIINALIVEEVQGKEYVKSNINIVDHKIPKKYYKDSEYAIALRKGSPILEEVNHIITNLKENGTLKELKNKWIK